ncbi:MAG: MBL fold metallo-hydrolase [Nanobdellota archaeon]
MKINIHGAGKEVGRSCIEASFGQRRFLFDAGLKISPDTCDLPLKPQKLETIQNVLISHIHLDHTGALPYFYANGLRSPIYASRMTKKLLKLLLKDSWKISRIEKREVGYAKSDINKVLELVIPSEEEIKIPEGKINFYNAGHIPGAKVIRLEINNQSILYTGDISLVNTPITDKAEIDKFPESDVLICESTYGDKDHENRDEVEIKLLNKIKEIINKGESVLIPTFSIGRAQQLIMMLMNELKDITSTIPVYLDGMARDVADKYIKNKDLIINGETLEESLDKVNFIKNQAEREKAVKNQSIILTTSGMLDGGPVLYYIPYFENRKDSGILLTGYQAEQTNGRMLLENGSIIIEGKEHSVNCFVKKYDLSAHAGRNQLLEIIEKVSPKHLILVHGEEEKMLSLKEKLKEKTSMEIHIPSDGDTIEIR